MTRTIPGRRCRGDDGAALVEAAIAFPLLAMLLFGIMEFGLGWRDKVTAETATRAAARTGSNLGNTAQADYNILQTALSALSSITAADIDMVIVYKAIDVNGTIDATCAAGTSKVNVCNVYKASSFGLAATSFGCGASSPDRYWCPTARVVDQSTGPDYLGIYVVTKHQFITRIFGAGPITVRSVAVLRLEPQG